MMLAAESLYFSHVRAQIAVIERRVAALSMEIAAEPIGDGSRSRYFPSQILPACDLCYIHRNLRMRR